MKLVFGFESFSYPTRYSAKSPLTASVKKRKPKSGLTRSQKIYGQGKTTVQVAEELEDKYHIVATFSEMNSDFFTSLFEDVFVEQFEEIATMRKSSKKGLMSKQTDKIEARFRESLSKQRYDSVIPGVPTLASLRGVSHLRQHPYAKSTPRPSFIDTGMYQRSFRAWVEQDEDD